MLNIQDLIERRNTRRALLKNALVGAAGLAGAGLLARTADASSAPAPAINDGDILNFALNLEYLEAGFYTYATTGDSLEAATGMTFMGVNTGGGDPGPITIKPTSPKVPFSSAAIEQFALDITVDEQSHVLFIRSALANLGITPVARPAIDLLNSFNTLAQVAGLGNSFDPFASDVNFLLGSYIFEDVGVSAYRGAAPLLKNKDVLSAAAGILAVEAYHSGLIRTTLYEQGQGDATQAISNVRASLGGPSPDYGVKQGPKNKGPLGSASIALVDGNALSGSRTTRQVLNIAYGAANATSGLFFPMGVNGTIRS